MYIDFQKFVELLVEASGITEEKVTAQIEELVQEIEQTISGGEAYEIEGVGIFSGLGDRIIFIPSKALETEINFKYVGMQPIEMEESKDNYAKDDRSAELRVTDGEKPSSTKHSSLIGLLDKLEKNDKSKPKDSEKESSFEDIFGEESGDSSTTIPDENTVDGSSLDAELAGLITDDVEEKSVDELDAGFFDDTGSDKVFTDPEDEGEEEPTEGIRKNSLHKK